MTSWCRPPTRRFPIPHDGTHASGTVFVTPRRSRDGSGVRFLRLCAAPPDEERSAFSDPLACHRPSLPPASLYFFNSSSITFLNTGYGCGPTMTRLLIKNVGVPRMPTLSPAALSLATSSL